MRQKPGSSWHQHGQPATPGYEFGVYVVNKLPSGYTAEQLARTVHDQWGMGAPACGNGVLLLMSKQDRAAYWSTGDEAGRVLTQDRIDRILNEAKPVLRSGNFSRGVARAAEATAVLLAEECSVRFATGQGNKAALLGVDSLPEKAQALWPELLPKHGFGEWQDGGPNYSGGGDGDGEAMRPMDLLMILGFVACVWALVTFKDEIQSATSNRKAEQRVFRLHCIAVLKGLSQPEVELTAVVEQPRTAHRQGDGATEIAENGDAGGDAVADTGDSNTQHADFAGGNGSDGDQSDRDGNMPTLKEAEAQLEGGLCSLCMETGVTSDPGVQTSVVLPCGHVYHSACLYSGHHISNVSAGDELQAGHPKDEVAKTRIGMCPACRAPFLATNSPAPLPEYLLGRLVRDWNQQWDEEKSRSDAESLSESLFGPDPGVGAAAHRFTSLKPFYLVPTAQALLSAAAKHPNIPGLYDGSWMVHASDRILEKRFWSLSKERKHVHSHAWIHRLGTRGYSLLDSWNDTRWSLVDQYRGPFARRRLSRNTTRDWRDSWDDEDSRIDEKEKQERRRRRTDGSDSSGGGWSGGGGGGSGFSGGSYSGGSSSGGGGGSW